MRIVGPVGGLVLLYKHIKSRNQKGQHSQKEGNRTQSDAQETARTGEVARPEDEPGKIGTTQSNTGSREERKAATIYRIRVIAGLVFPFSLSALDTTIIASALPWIASDFHKISQLNWIISAFNLTSAAFIPFWGQMADIFGRHTAIQMCLILMLVGSALTTGAPTDAFAVLLLGRSFQGLSVAGIVVITKVILADKVSLEENAKNTSIFSVFAGISYGIGPVIGGYLTDKSWRWCFGINIPVAIAGIVMVFFVLRTQLLGPQPLPSVLDHSATLSDATNELTTLKARLATIDYGGQVLFLSGSVLLILALTWGGASYKWTSPNVLAPLILGSVLIVLFVSYEYSMAPGRYVARKFPAQKATLPWNLMAQRNMGLLFYINFATGFAMMSVLYFVDIYFTLVRGFAASKAGVQLLYYTPGIGIGVYSAMFMCKSWPKQTFLPLFLGSIIEATGITVLTWALYNEHSPTIYGMMGLTGAGTGLRFMPGTLHGIAFFPNHIASVISMMAFAIPFGGMIAMTIMGTIFNNKSGQVASSTIQTDIDGSVMDLKAVKMGVVWAFVGIVPFMWVCVLAAAGLGNVRITSHRVIRDSGEVDFSESVEEGPYLLRLCWRSRKRAGTRDTERVEPELV